MYRVTIFSFVLTFCCTINAQKGPCTQGECKSIYKCQPLLALVNKANRAQKAQDRELLKKAHCGLDRHTPAVCCPKETDPLPVPSNRCYTPRGEEGKCVSLYSCPDLANLLKPPVLSNVISYIQNSKCIGPDHYSVCCGPVPDLTTNKPRTLHMCDNTRSAFPPDPESECCGADSTVGNKIIGGLPSPVERYPWLALIEYTHKGAVKTLCGGALISSKYVMTAAHCVIGQVLIFGTPTAIRLAEYDVTNDGEDCALVEAGGLDCNEGVTTIPIERTIPHPEYNPGNARNRHDIALIRMTEFAPFTDFIRPICLPTVDMTLRTTPFNLIAAGWGAAISTRQNSSALKLHVELPFVPQDQCQPAYQVYSRKVTLWKGQLCAGGQNGKDSCKGDSGGPLMYENGRTYEVIGVVSFGPSPCGLMNIPDVYTNVYEYNTWIRNTITP